MFSPMSKIGYEYSEGKRRPRATDLKPVFAKVMEGASLRAACRDVGVHPGHMHAFIKGNEEWWAQYCACLRAREDILAEQALSLGVAAATGQTLEGRAISPDGARVALAAIQWVTGRMQPKEPTRHIHEFANAPDDVLDKRLAALMAKTGVPDEEPDESGED